MCAVFCGGKSVSQKSKSVSLLQLLVEAECVRVVFSICISNDGPVVAADVLW